MLFHILWHDHEFHYFIDKGAYNHEEEILLLDGVEFQVVSVKDEEYEEFELQNMEHKYGSDTAKNNGDKVLLINKFQDHYGHYEHYGVHH